MRIRRVVLIAALVGAGLAFAILAGKAMAVDVERQLVSMGYARVIVEPSPATWYCAKGRFTYSFTAVRSGQPVTGHACAGGFLGVAVNEDGQ